MLNGTRIKRLYVKDLLDILRDRRTLITLVAVPIVLYPGLMLCFIQMGTIQAGQIKEQTVHIGLRDEGLQTWLHGVLSHARSLARLAEDSDLEAVPPAVQEWKFHLVEGDLQGWVREGFGHCAVELSPPTAEDGPHKRLVDIYEDSAEIRSAMAAETLRRVLLEDAEFQTTRRLRALGVPEALIDPLAVDVVDVATAIKRGGSLLGQILPLVLVLMTITGAIYPAIDLTAGERERGTLETLVVCPVPVVEIIIGKFMVVATVSMLGAALNLASMGLTIHFGGLSEALASSADTEVPVGVLPIILLCLIPLSVLFSAVLLAVSSFAKSFKEAQAYVTPVIMAVLLPAGIAALPGSELAGATVVVPVANMVLLTRELLLGTVDASTILAVIVSTCFYAATAVAIAVKVFGQEAVLFADAGSWRAQFDRKVIQPADHPRSPLPLMYVALLFPAWLYLQTGLQQAFADMPALGLFFIQVAMAVLFLVVPWLLVVYYRINVRNAFSLRRPRARFLAGAVLIGSGTWALVHELVVFQTEHQLFGLSKAWVDRVSLADDMFKDLSPLQAIVLLALVPAICEEFLFRGLLLNGLRSALRRGSAILAVALIFAVYHFLIQRFAVTFVLGALLGWICWQSRSLWPAVVVHLLHNGIQVAWTLPGWRERLHDWLGVPADAAALGHLPGHVVGVTLCAVGVGMLLFVKPAPAVAGRPALVGESI